MSTLKSIFWAFPNINHVMWTWKLALNCIWYIIYELLVAQKTMRARENKRHKYLFKNVFSNLANFLTMPFKALMLLFLCLTYLSKWISCLKLQWCFLVWAISSSLLCFIIKHPVVYFSTKYYGFKPIQTILHVSEHMVEYKP